MTQFQVVCPGCGTVMLVPQSRLPQKSVQCANCGHLVDLHPVPAPPTPFQAAVQGSPGLHNNPANSQHATNPPAKSDGKLGWILALSITGGVAFISVIALVVVVVVSTNSDSSFETESSSNKTTASNDSGKPSMPEVAKSEMLNVDDESNPFGATIPFDQLSAYQPALAEIHYKLASGEKFAINYKYRADLGGPASMLSGSIMYEGTDRSPADVVSGKQEEEGESEGNGTGFIVRPDGFLVTNAHVVQGATSIEARLDGNNYAAKVVALDSKNDLAIVRIHASNLPHLTIQDSDQVRLAEEVRAFGFPMVNQLGESIKITRGTVAGVTKQDDSKMFQLDVTVNPGNSGGPVVNDRGQVVGVVTSLMTGAEIADMSFAVTSNDVRRLLERHGLKYHAAESSATVMSGPDLADRVQRSVALLKVRIGPGGFGIAEKQVIQYHLDWMGRNENSRGQTTGRMDVGKESGVILLNPSGEVAYCDGKKMLPAQLGLIATLGLQPLSEDDSKKWHSARLTLVPEKRSVSVPSSRPSGLYPDRISPYRGYPGRYSPYGGLRSRFAPPTTSLSTVKLHPAIEMTKFEILNTSGDLVNIKKMHELVTISNDDDPYLRVSGQGTFQFDKRKGLPRSLEVDGMVAAANSQIPFTLEFSLEDAEELAKKRAESAERLKKALAESQRRRAQEEAKRNAYRVTADTIPVSPGLNQLDLAK